MRRLTLAKRIGVSICVLAVLVLMGLSLLAGTGQEQSQRTAYGRAFGQLTVRPPGAEPMILPAEKDTCGLLLYLSLPPKCKTLDGRFILANDGSPYILKISEEK